MLNGTPDCVVSPSPELEERILNTRDQILSGKAPPAKGTKNLVDAVSYGLIIGRPSGTRAHTLVSPTKDFAPVTGTRQAVVLLVDFSDEPATETQAHFSDMLFSVGSYPGGSMRDFYLEASYNQLSVTGAVYGSGGPTAGWFRAPNPKSYYTDGNFGFNGYPKNAQRLVEDVLDAANATVNFSAYDNGTGSVEALIVICAGVGGEETGDTGDIWSHKWGIAPRTLDGVTVDRYFMAPENGRVGVMAHELGHLLMGWPDLYDTDYSSAGTGRWDLMAGGSWNDGGNTPAHPTAWCKAKVGWVNPTTVFNSEVSATLQPYAENDQVYKLPVGTEDGKEYFLLSNRKKTGFDAHIPGEGLIIEHCDDGQNNNADENHYLVDIEQADGLRDLNLNANRGDVNDPYPTDTNNKFTSSSSPNSNAYDGSASEVSVTDVAESGGNITATLKVQAVNAQQWVSDKDVLRAYSSNDSQNAWAFLDGIGWRQIHPNAADGVTNVLVAVCEAVGNQRKVHAYIDASFLYRVQLL